SSDVCSSDLNLSGLHFKLRKINGMITATFRKIDQVVKIMAMRMIQVFVMQIKIVGKPAHHNLILPDIAQYPNIYRREFFFCHPLLQLFIRLKLTASSLFHPFHKSILTKTGTSTLTYLSPYCFQT